MQILTKGARRVPNRQGKDPHPEIAYTAWINEEEKTVTFHAAARYAPKTFPDRSSFFTELLILAGEGYRFQ